MASHQVIIAERKQGQLLKDTAVVGPKPFALAQHALSTCRKTAVQTADTACLQIGSLCWYPSEGTYEITFEITIPLGYNGVMGDYLLCLLVWEILIISFKLRDRRYSLFILILFPFVIV